MNSGFYALMIPKVYLFIYVMSLTCTKKEVTFLTFSLRTAAMGVNI